MYQIGVAVLASVYKGSRGGGTRVHVVHHFLEGEGNPPPGLMIAYAAINTKKGSL